MTRLKDLLGVLIVSSNDNSAKKLADSLDSAVFEPISIAKNAEEARRLTLHESYDIVIINAPLPTESGHDLALDIAENFHSAVMLLVKNESYDETRYRVEDAGVLALSKPFSMDTFHSCINILVATHNRIRLMEEENRKLREKLEESRLVNRAKWVLVENCAMSEKQAHKHIEKSAMDKRLTRLVVAKDILKEYS